jgi:hypothetical protein
MHTGEVDFFSGFFGNTYGTSSNAYSDCILHSNQLLLFKSGNVVIVGFFR